MNTYMKGGYKAYDTTKPGYARAAYPTHVHHRVIVDSDDRKPEIIYAEYRNDQKYVEKAEQVIELRHRPGGGAAGVGLGGHSHSPPRKDRPGGLGAGLGLGGQRSNKDTLVPWRKPMDRRDNHQKSPTKAHGHETDNGGSPRYDNKYPNNGVYNRTMYPKPRTYDDSSSEDEDGSDSETNDVECDDGVCRPKQPKVNFSDPYYSGQNFQEYPKQQTNKAHPETIDSSEAKRRYGGVAVHTEKRSEPKYTGTIDCKEAAERYNGIFVPGNNF